MRRLHHLGAFRAAPDAEVRSAPCAWNSSVSDLARAVPAIVELRDYHQRHRRDVQMLAGLEHLDERYVKAVKYATKAPRRRAAKDGAAGGHCRVRRRGRRSGGLPTQVVRLANARDG